MGGEQKMDYYLTFIVADVTKNTWTDWHLVPSTPPMVSPPAVDTRYTDIPGRSNGPLDMTMIPFNKVTYKRMTGSWTFYREPETKYTRKELFEILRAYFTGNVGRVTLSEDPTHYFVGRFDVSSPRTSTGPIEYTISYDLEPARYNSDGTVDSSYASPSGSGYMYGGGGGSPIYSGITIEYDSSLQDLRVSGFE